MQLCFTENIIQKSIQAKNNIQSVERVQIILPFHFAVRQTHQIARIKYGFGIT